MPDKPSELLYKQNDLFNWLALCSAQLTSLWNTTVGHYQGEPNSAGCVTSQ